MKTPNAVINYRSLIECLLIIIGFLFLGFVMALLDAHDEAMEKQALIAENNRLKAPAIGTCRYEKYNVLVEYPDCIIIKHNYAKLIE